MRFPWWLALPLILLTMPLSADAQPVTGEPLPPGATARFGSMKWRLPDTLRGLALSPDGKIAAASAKGAVTVWDVAGDRELCYLSDSSAVYGEVAISPDGKLLAVAVWGKTHAVRIFELPTGKQKMQLETPEDGHEPIAFAPDGKKLVTGGATGPTTVWDYSTGKKMWEYRSEDGRMIPFALSTDGRWLALAESKKKLLIFDFESGQRRFTLEIPNGILHSAFSPDARSLMVADKSTLTMYEVASGNIQSQIPAESFSKSSQFAPDGKKLAVFGDDGIHWLDPLSGKSLGLWQGHRSLVTNLAISKDGRTAVSASYDGSVFVWDAVAGKVIRGPVGLASTCDFLAFEGDDKTILTCGNQFHFLGAKTLEEEKRLPLATSDKRQAIALSPNRKMVAYAQEDDTIALIDVPGRKVLRRLPCPIWLPEALAFGPDSKKLYAFKSGTDASERISRVWDVETGKEMKPNLESLGLFLDLASSSQGKVATAAHRTIAVLDLATGKKEDGFNCQARRLLFSHDGNVLAANGEDERVTLLDFKKRTELIRLGEFKEGVGSWCFSRDDKMLALGHGDGSFTIWSVPGGKKLGEWKGHRGAITALAFSHNGETLVTGSSDGTILKWPAKAWRGK
jgi:WD40 repeat protein